jgi:uncharacterized membrane protein
MKKILLFFVAVGSAMGAGVASAVPASAIDVSDVTTTLSNQLTPIGLVGAGVLVLVAVLAAYKFVKRAA